MKVTAYFDVIKRRPDRIAILDDWIEKAVQAMKVRYFEETDTLYMELMPLPVVETRDIDENTTLDLDAEGNICAITIEHASKRAGIPQFSFEKVAA